MRNSLNATMNKEITADADGFVDDVDVGLLPWMEQIRKSFPELY